MEIKQRNTLIICMSLLAVFLLFAALGSGVETEQGRQIIFLPITEGGVIYAIDRVCAASALDVCSLMLITLLSHPAASMPALVGVIALRGAVLGCTAEFLAANTASVAGVVYSVVYVISTLLICGYGGLINRNKLSRLTLLCLYGAVSGTLVILRGLSMLIT